jgi:BTB/POZ domain/Kelch motif/Galactose oxidase, central domain
MAWIHPPAIGCRFSYLHMPCGRCGHSAVLRDKSVLIFGGFDGKKWLNDLHEFDSRSLVWSQPRVIGTAPHPRQYHTASFVENSMFIFGGYDGTNWLRDLVVLDTSTYKWSYPKTSGDVPTGREGHVMMSYNNSLYIHGGWDGGSIGDIYKIDISTLIWERINITGEKPLLCGHTSTQISSQVYLFGGFDGNNWVNSLYKIQLPECKIAKIHTKNEPTSRGYHSAALVNKYILIYAGYNGKYILGDLIAFDTESLTWSLPDSCLGYVPAARNAHTTTLLGSELFVFGGYNGNHDTNDLYILETSAFSTMQDDLKSGINFKFGMISSLKSRDNTAAIHSVVLRSRCSKLADTSQELNISGQALEELVKYLYCDNVSDAIPIEVCQELIALADRLDLKRLKALCDDEMDLPDSNLSNDITEIKNFIDLHDFIIQIQDKEFYLHQFILAARCPYFKAMFQSHMSENSQHRLQLNYFTPEAFEYIIEWIYSDKFGPLLGDTKLSLDLYIEILIETNMLGLESLLRIVEIATEQTINTENAVKIFEAAHTLGTIRLKSYAINYILQELDKISIKHDLMSLNDNAFEELNNFLPRRLKRQTSKNAIFPCLSFVKFDNVDMVLQNNINVKPHDPKSSKMPGREFQGILSLRNPLNYSSAKQNNDPHRKNPNGKRQDRNSWSSVDRHKTTPELIVQGISPRHNTPVDRSSTTKHFGMQIFSNLTTLYPQASSEIITGSGLYYINR